MSIPKPLWSPHTRPYPKESRESLQSLLYEERQTRWLFGKPGMRGVGLDEHAPEAHEPPRWRGLNLLGFALMQVRSQLQQGR